MRKHPLSLLAPAALGLLLYPGVVLGQGTTPGNNGTQTGNPASTSSLVDARRPDDKPIPSDRKGFVDAAASADQYEVEAGRLAATRASSTELKRFGDMMVTDHTATTNRLKAILMRSAPEIQPASMDARKMAMLDELRRAADFDRAYIDQQIEVHREALALMRGYGDKGDNAELREFARTTAPAVAMHLEMIEKIAQREKR